MKTSPTNHAERAEQKRFLPLIAGVLLFSSLLFVLFGSIIFGGEQFAYRDAGYYHYPFGKQILDDSGKIPLWDPYENLGVPLAGNPVAAVFYPVRIAVFSGTHFGLSYDACFKFYILLHLAIAFAAFLYLAHTPRSGQGQGPLVSRPGSLAAALAWTFGGTVLFQTTNVPFLAGAAWLPLLIGAEIRLLTRPTFSACAAAVFAPALMITGGDPQTALFGTLLFFPFFFGLKKGSASGRTRGGNEGIPDGGGRAMTAFGCSIFLALTLSAIQILPAAETALLSSRHRQNSSSAVELREAEREIYNFSVPPWRVTEFFWPGIGGDEFPENTRWFTALPNDRQVWTPSLYLGLFPLLAALSVFRLRWRKGEEGESERIRVLMTWLTLFALAAAWGGFGLGWLKRILTEPGGVPAWTFRDGDPVGGVYWFLTRLVPGWSAFRYPAKMMTFASLALALLAGIGWDRYTAPGHKHRTVSPGLLLLFGLSVAGLCVVCFSHPTRLAARFGIDFVSVRTLYGPLLIDGAKTSAAMAFARTAVLTLLLVSVPFLRKIPHVARRGKFFAVAGLLLLCVDLAVAQKWMTRGVPEAAFRTKSPIAAELFRLTSGRAAPPRLFRDSFLYPRSFIAESSVNRLEERLRWDRLTLFQKDAASAGVANIDVRGTFVPAEYLTVSRYLRSELGRLKRSGEPSPGFNRLLAALGTDALLVSVGKIRFEEIPHGGKRVHILHRPERFAVWQDLVRRPLESEPLDGESAEIVFYRSDRLEIEAELVEPGTLLVAEEYWPGWRARLLTASGEAELPIRRLASVLRAVDLPAGKSRVTMEYRPLSYRVGAAITAASILFLFVAALFTFLPPRFSPEKR
jgi:hypothetical protein